MVTLINIPSGLPKEIYADMCLQFPKCELKEFSLFKHILETNPSYKVYKALFNGEEIGYVILYIDEEKKILWLDYIAVYKEFRSRGYGSRIFEELRKNFSAYSGIYTEVEKPDKEDTNTLRRIAFYHRLGSKKLDIKYLYPNAQGSFEMDLYFLPFQKNYIPSKLSIKNTIHSVFGAIHSDISHIKAVLDKIVI